MATNYPAALDTITELPDNRTDATVTATSHAADHNNLSDAVRAIEAELGTLPKGSSADVKTRLGTLAPLASPAFTGTPAATTAAQGTNTTQLATTAYVQTETGLLVPKSLVDAKGDLLVGTADNAVARLGVGSNGQALVADSSQSAGVKWGSPTRNIVSQFQTADYAPSGAASSFTQLGSVAPSITINAGSQVLVRGTGRFSTSDNTQLNPCQLNIDSGGTIVKLGRFSTDGFGLCMDFQALVAGLSAGAHTFWFEYKKTGTGSLLLRVSTQSALERFGIILEEIF